LRHIEIQRVTEEAEFKVHPQIHAIFDGIAILTLAIGLHFRLRRHPLYTFDRLLNGVIYVVWTGILLAWLPNLLPPLRNLIIGIPISENWWRAGLDNWMLGLAGGLLAGYFYIHRNHLPLWFVFDRAAALLALTLVIWRIGCAINGDAYGKVTDSWFGLWLPDVNGTYAIRYPTQYVSIVMNLLIAIALLGFEQYALKQLKKPVGWPFPGFLFWTYIGLYCVQRFVFEFWRGDKTTIYHSFTLTHVYCVIGILLAIWGLRRGWKKWRTQPTMPALEGTK